MRRPQFLLSLIGMILIGGVNLGCNQQSPLVLALIGKKAPDFTFTDLESGNTQMLSEFSGKIIFLEFWATWCVPCRTTMTDLQSYTDTYPEWKDRVVLLTISIDEDPKLAKRQIASKKWNRTQNGWIDPAGGTDPIFNAYAGKGIPAAYVISPDGMIADAGNPETIDLAKSVSRLLKTD